MTVAKMKSLLENDSVKAAANARAEGYATPLTEMFIKAAYAGILFDGRLARRTGKLVMEIAYTEACAVARAKRMSLVRKSGICAKSCSASALTRTPESGCPISTTLMLPLLAMPKSSLSQ